jgi:hypothetical protein
MHLHPSGRSECDFRQPQSLVATSASSLIDKVASNIAQVVDKKQVKYWLQLLADF